jgi:hypothetical protein
VLKYQLMFLTSAGDWTMDFMYANDQQLATLSAAADFYEFSTLYMACVQVFELALVSLTSLALRVAGRIVINPSFDCEASYRL